MVSDLRSQSRIKDPGGEIRWEPGDAGREKKLRAEIPESRPRGRRAIFPLTSGLIFKKKIGQGGNNSVVECNLAKVEVAGSNPVSRSIVIFEAA
jgi:hypothetical protein